MKRPTLHGFVLSLAILLMTLPGGANVRLVGAWPDAENPVSLEANQLPRSEAVRRIADAMGWSVVLHAPSTEPVDLHVKQQPVSKVLSMILSDQEYVAKREGTLISIEPAKTKTEEKTAIEASKATPDPEPSPPATPTVTIPANPPDRVVSGGKVRVEKDEVVRDVVVFGGSSDVFGTVTGDVTVIGGAARIHSGAHVMGDATAVGGSLDVDNGATVDGDVGVVGGVLRRGEEARIGGKSRSEGSRAAKHTESRDRSGGGILASIGRAITSAALLFILGSVLLALASRRMDTLQVELAARPMRSFALGIVGSIVGLLLLAALIISLVGIPVAIVAAVLAVVSVYVGICAVLTMIGGVLLRHKTRNPYIHLAVGCVLFLVAKALPIVGSLVLLVVLVLGIGALVATRGAGLIPPRKARVAT